MVVGVIIWDGQTDYQPADGLTAIAVEEGVIAGPGWKWNGTTFDDMRPAEPNPDDA